jgi:hypothetical protein
MSQITPLPIAPPPGVVATESQLAATGRWTLPWQWFRFVEMKPQKIGGFVQAFATPTSGTPRSLWAWRDLVSNQYLAAGTYRKLYVYDTAGAQNDITPFRLTGTLSDPFATSSGSSIVTVTHTAHGLNPGDQVIFPQTTTTGNTNTNTTLNGLADDLRNLVVGATVTGVDIPTSPATTVASVGSSSSLTLSQAATGSHSGNTYTFAPGVGNGTGAFVVATVISANSYTFDCGVAATATVASGGGTVSYEYEVPIGTELAAAGYGWGVGPWGLGTWGTSRTTSTITIEPRVWALDNFGKILLATDGPEGSLFQFDPTQAQPWPRAQLVSAAPTTIRSMFVTPEEFVFALCDGLVVDGSTQGDFTVWTPATANTAFSRTLAIGSKLVAGRVLQPYISLIWTDAALYVFQYTGDAFVYQSAMVARDCGLIGPSAAITVNGAAYWMGADNFWMYNGSVVAIPNVENIRKYVYDQLNLVNGYQCAAIYNPKYHEVWFEITVMGQTNPTLLVIYHIQSQCWTPHSLTRVSGTHYTSSDTRPYMGDASGVIYQHESGLDANGSPITSTMTLAPYAMNSGLQAMDLEGILFDTFQQAGSITLTVNTYDRLTDSSVEDTETDIIPAASAGLTDIRVAGRYVGFTATQNALGAYFRLGAPVAFVRPTAKRR